MAQRSRPRTLPPQQQNRQPGRQKPMRPPPQSENLDHSGSGKLTHKVAVITGGDSGIGRAVAIAFAKEGARIVVGYLNERQDALKTKQLVEAEGMPCVIVPGDIGKEAAARTLIQKAVKRFGKI